MVYYVFIQLHSSSKVIALMHFEELTYSVVLTSLFDFQRDKHFVVFVNNFTFNNTFVHTVCSRYNIQYNQKIILFPTIFLHTWFFSFRKKTYLIRKCIHMLSMKWLLKLFICMSTKMIYFCYKNIPNATLHRQSTPAYGNRHSWN